MNTKGKIAILGGTGLYDLDAATEVREHRVSTPFGDPSDPILEITQASSSFLFLSRHGKGHRLSPSEINYRANIYALKSLGAAWCISVSAVGSLREEMKPGDIVVPHQLIDKTKFRTDSFFTEGVVAHVSLAEPFCPVLRQAVLDCARPVSIAQHFTVHPSGTYICMEGPAFSTRAEAHMHRAWGADIIGMTNAPEAKLAREAEMAYGTIALVTDYDCWKEDGNDVEALAIVDVIQRNVKNAKAILEYLLPVLGTIEPSPLASNALQNAIFSDLTTVAASVRERLQLLIGRYLR